MNKLFTGCATALITPFKNGDIDYEALDKLIELQISNGIRTLVVNGTTGESATLSNYEKNILLSYIIDKVNGRCKIIAGTGSNNTNTAIELSQDAEDLGADALLVVTPYYNKCSQEGLYEHYAKIAENVNIPVILYNVPSRTNVNIEPETVLKLSMISNIIGIKEASKNIDHITKLFSIFQDKDFFIYSGNDDLTYLFYTLGGSGLISVISNLLPFEISSMCNALDSENFKKGKFFQFKYLPIMNEIFSYINPIGIKECMNIANLCSNELRLPLTNIKQSEKIKLEALLNEYNIR